MSKYDEFPSEFQDVTNWLFRAPKKLNGYRFFYEAGVVEALQDAFSFWLMLPSTTERNREGMPAWMINGLEKMIRFRMEKGASTGNPGQHANDSKKLAAYRMHLTRYMMVKNERKRTSNYEEAYERVADIVSNDEIVVSPDTIQTSYKKVRKFLANSEDTTLLYAGWAKLASYPEGVAIARGSQP